MLQLGYLKLPVSLHCRMDKCKRLCEVLTEGIHRVVFLRIAQEEMELRFIAMRARRTIMTGS